MKKSEALKIARQAQEGNVLALRRLIKIVDALRSQRFNFDQTAKLLELEARELDSLILEAEEVLQ